jgi:hypothetical protein
MFEHHIQLKELCKQHTALEQYLSAKSEQLQSEEQKNSR